MSLNCSQRRRNSPAWGGGEEDEGAGISGDLPQGPGGETSLRPLDLILSQKAVIPSGQESLVPGSTCVFLSFWGVWALPFLPLPRKEGLSLATDSGLVLRVPLPAHFLRFLCGEHAGTG
jgi:hypothetical protein